MKVAILLVSLAAVALAVNNGLGKTPQMGWNSWNKYGCNINEKIMKVTMDRVVELGLDKLGYRYVNVDDCWAGSRTDDGYVVEDPKTFPSGMKALADYAHSKGLLFGLYSDAGSKTCAGRPGSLGFERQDAESYAKWGVDYLKYDNCNDEGLAPQPRDTTMAKAIAATGASIFYSLCEWGVDTPHEWAGKIANSWRTTNDISDNYNSMLVNIIFNNASAPFAGPGAWNDPDMLEVGNGGMNYEEYKIHFSLWCLVKSPLLIGCDLSNPSNETLTILMNTEAIAINQDPLGVQGTLQTMTGQYQIWGGPLSDGYAVVIIGNMQCTGGIKVNVPLSQFGLKGTVKARDLWQHKDVGTFTGELRVVVDRNVGIFYKLTPA